MLSKKKVIRVALVVSIVTLMSLASYSFARYYQNLNIGGGKATIARWSFGSKNTSEDIILSENKIAPGSSGTFEIEVDATNSEVPVEYEILVSDEKNIPTNMTFYAEVKDQNETLLKTTETTNSFTELAVNNLKGLINVENGNQKRNIVVHWNWEFNEEDTSSTDANDAILSYDANNKSSLECGFNIEILGKQAKVN